MDLNRLRDDLSHKDPDIFSALTAEEDRQRKGLELIPSENYCFPEVLPLLGSAFTNKYSEGYPGRRYYGGQPNTDTIETLARERACSLFRAAFVANCLRGAFPPVDFRAVCLVRAMTESRDLTF